MKALMAIVAIAAAMALAAHGAEVHDEVASPTASRVLAAWNGEVTGVSTNNGIVCMDYALRPTKRSFIRCQLLLPPKEKWTGRFWGQGNGGQAGGKPRAMTAFANVGDAVAHTDMGSSVASGNPDAWTDFAHRATHLMTLSAKALVEAHYGRPPRISFFYGASTGGNQGLMEAERYPEDYDGVLAIVPAFARVPYHVKYVWNARQVFRPDGSRALSDPQIAAVEKAVVDWFADKDELHARGKYIARAFWTAEDMDGVLALAASRDPSIGSEDVKARFRAVWDGPVINGRRAGLGLPPGARLSTWLAGRYTSKESWLWNWLSNGRRPLLSITDDELEAWAKGPAAQFNATNPDLSRFFARGGVLLMTGGAEDDICEPAPMVAFANEVIARNPVAPWPEKMSGSDEAGWRRVPDCWPVGGAIDPIYFMRGAGGACPLPASAAAPAASFADFDARARAGGRLTVAFFGGSLTWSANATEPNVTGFRGLMAKYLAEKYPSAHFTFVDAAIGGTGSNLGVFRLERDVLSKHPDLVFLDFSGTDPTDFSGTDPTKA